MSGVFLALGSNLGNRQANIALALRMLEPLVRVEAVSSLYETTPEGDQDQPSYYNAACRVVTGLTPPLLLRHLQRVEWDLGRRQPSHGHMRPRPIDLDIALYNDVVMDTEELSIPHSRLLQRAFVLRPLLDIAPDATDPRSGERLSDALRRTGDADLRLVGEGEWWRTRKLEVRG